MAKPRTEQTGGGPTQFDVVEAIRTIYDPEFPVNIHDLGLIYEVLVRPKGKVHVVMTLTSPACPVGMALPAAVESVIRTVDGVTDASVAVVWDPPWSPEMLSEAARLELNV